jgi:hypothetical protein
MSNYHNQDIEDMLDILEKNYDSIPNPNKEDYYYGEEFMQYRILETLQKNLIYLGSDCFKMFGVKINLQPWELYDSNVNKDAIIDIVESLPDGCINHLGKKYWKL